MIEMVSLAEDFIARNRKSIAVSAPAQRNAVCARRSRADRARRMQRKRRRIEGAWRRLILEFRGGETVLKFLQNKDLAALSESGVITPDHTIRTKNWPLLLPPPQPGKLDEFARAARAAADAFAGALPAYFARHNVRVGGIKRELDPLPRVVLVPGLGLFGLGRTKRDAVIAADIAETWIEGVADAEAIGRFESISEADMFDCEYWPLEQAKLGGGDRAAAGRPDRCRHRRRRRHRRCHRQGLRRGGRRDRACST